MKNDLDSQIQRRIEEFAKEMSELMRQAALESVREALGGGTAAPAPRRGRPPGRKAGGGKTAAKKTRKGKGKRGAKRTAAELQALEDNFLKEVKKQGGRRIEEISKELGVTTKDLALPVRKLMADKQIKTTGQKRATRYFAR